MNCEHWTREILERSRRGAGPSDALSMHLAECPRCSARWESQAELSCGLRHVRAAASRLRSPEAAREQLLAAFDARRAASRPRWMWAAVAAGIVLALAIALERQPAMRPFGGQQVQTEASPEELLANNEFVPVPYTPPLAQGEVVEVVRLNLSPAALARLGFVTQAGYSNEITADLAIGEDGQPRAVRLPESVEVRY